MGFQTVLRSNTHQTEKTEHHVASLTCGTWSGKQHTDQTDREAKTRGHRRHLRGYRREVAGAVGDVRVTGKMTEGLTPR